MIFLRRNTSKTKRLIITLLKRHAVFLVNSKKFFFVWIERHIRSHNPVITKPISVSYQLVYLFFIIHLYYFQFLIYMIYNEILSASRNKRCCIKNAFIIDNFENLFYLFNLLMALKNLCISQIFFYSYLFFLCIYFIFLSF